jgi:hypothetical protein
VTAPGWLDAVPSRPFTEEGLETWLPLPPGDRPLVEAGESVESGDPIVEHLRDPRLDEVSVHVTEGRPAPAAGRPWIPEEGAVRRGQAHPGRLGELLAPIPGRGDRWRIVTGDHRDTLASPVGGTVIEVLPGARLGIRVGGRAIRGAFAAGSSSRGRLELATDPFGELRAGGIGVARAGSILVVGARIDAEALTRARAMGVRGIVVESLPGKDLRDFMASERRQAATLHGMAPFGVLVLGGTVRRPIPSPIATLFERLAGRDVALLVDPPALVFDDHDLVLPDIAPDWILVRSGPNAGAEGRVVGLGGSRRFAANVVLDTASVEIGDEAPVDLPVGDLERFILG